MASNQDEKLYLVAVKGTSTRVVKEGVPKILGAEKKRLIASGNWKGWVFQIRNPAGYAKVKIRYDENGKILNK